MMRPRILSPCAPAGSIKLRATAGGILQVPTVPDVADDNVTCDAAVDLMGTKTAPTGPTTEPVAAIAGVAKDAQAKPANAIDFFIALLAPDSATAFILAELGE